MKIAINKKCLELVNRKRVFLFHQDNFSLLVSLLIRPKLLEFDWDTFHHPLYSYIWIPIYTSHFVVWFSYQTKSTFLDYVSMYCVPFLKENDETWIHHNNNFHLMNTVYLVELEVHYYQFFLENETTVSNKYL